MQLRNYTTVCLYNSKCFNRKEQLWNAKKILKSRENYQIRKKYNEAHITFVFFLNKKYFQKKIYIFQQ